MSTSVCLNSLKFAESDSNLNITLEYHIEGVLPPPSDRNQIYIFIRIGRDLKCNIMPRPGTRSNRDTSEAREVPRGPEQGIMNSTRLTDEDAGHSTETSAPGKGISVPPDLLQKSIVEALCAEDTRKKLVDAIVDVIVHNVTQSVYDAVRLDLDRQKEELTSLTKKVDELNKDIVKLKSSCEVQEQYSRRNCLRFHGIPEDVNENTDKVVRQVVKEKLGIDLAATDIDRSHRITPRQATPGDGKPRVIIMKFARYNVRQLIYSNRAKLKGTKIFIHEDLTSHRQSLVNVANRSPQVLKVYTTDGRVKALKKSTNKWVNITSVNQIDKLDS